MDLVFAGSTRLTIPVPALPGLAGAAVYFQGASLGPGNRLGVTALGTARIGAR